MRLSVGRPVRNNGMIEIHETLYKTKVVEKGVCLSTCHLEVACGSGVVYYTHPTSVN